MLRNEVMRSGEAGVQLPVNFRRLIWNAQQIFKCRPHRQGPTGAPAAHPLGPLPHAKSMQAALARRHMLCSRTSSKMLQLETQ